MRNSVLCFLILSLILFFSGCSKEKEADSKIIARVNNYRLTFDEFQRQLTAELEYKKDFKLTGEARAEFLEGLIRKELLIQEAKKMKLDREEKFVQAIERYWELTLIRDLIDLKGEEFSQKVYVSEEEIDALYQTMKARDEALPPLDEIHDKIKKELREKKKSSLLEAWENSLRQSADVEIKKDLR